MQRTILIVDAEKRESKELLGLLRAQNYSVTVTHSIHDVESLTKQLQEPIIILDLDTVPITNRILRTLRKNCPHLPILALSQRPFHPELQEAMVDHIYACLRKPLDPDELLFWLKSIAAGSVKAVGAVERPSGGGPHHH